MDITPAIFLVSFLCFAERHKLMVQGDRRVEAKLMTSLSVYPFFVLNGQTSCSMTKTR